MVGYFIIAGIMGLLGMLISSRLKSKFNHYSKFALSNGLTGREIAEKMLRDNGISDVRVTQVAGALTDHYNPGNRTVNLSEPVYHGNSAASAAVAAHECGHAIQHATSYSMLGLRSKLVPLQNISGSIMNAVFLFGGFMGLGMNQGGLAIGVIVACYSIITLFALVTLPVEFDASKRALQWMETNGVVNSQEHGQAKDALKWAAMTYVVAALSAVVTLLYFLAKFAGSRD